MSTYENAMNRLLDVKQDTGASNADGVVCKTCPCDTALPVTILGLDKLPAGSTVNISIVIGGTPPKERPEPPARIYAGTAPRPH